MQYRTIPSKDVRLLPDYINLLRNFQDMHAALGKISIDFPITELSSVIPNYESKFNDFTLRGNKIISKFKIVSALHKVYVDYTVGSFSSEKLLLRKENLISVLEKTIDKWQNICDQIEKIEDSDSE